MTPPTDAPSPASQVPSAVMTIGSLSVRVANGPQEGAAGPGDAVSIAVAAVVATPAVAATALGHVARRHKPCQTSEATEAFDRVAAALLRARSRVPTVSEGPASDLVGRVGAPAKGEAIGLSKVASTTARTFAATAAPEARRPFPRPT